MAWHVILLTMLHQHAVAKKDSVHCFLKIQELLHTIIISDLGMHISSHFTCILLGFPAFYVHKILLMALEKSENRNFHSYRTGVSKCFSHKGTPNIWKGVEGREEILKKIFLKIH